jgi:hypothetical protein
VFPETTFEEYARPQLAELQLDAYLDWTTEGLAPFAVTEFEIPRVNVLPRVSVGVEGGF